MTEADWNSCADPSAMLNFLCDSGKLSERKNRLFAVACCRRVWGLLSDPRSRLAVEAAERYADGLARREELAVPAAEARLAAFDLIEESESGSAIARGGATSVEASAANGAAWAAADPDVRNAGFARNAAWVITWSCPEGEEAAQAALLRDIFGSRFRPVALDPAWLSPALLNLAQAVYDNQLLPSGLLDNTGLAILADALEDANCTDATILSHLRGAGPHVRGCWVLDSLLGKS
jgi:hypothetical protein